MKLRNLATLTFAAAVLSGSAISSFAAPAEAPDNAPGAPPHRGKGRSGGLSPENREKVAAVMDKVKDQPAVKAAADARRDANKEYNEASKKAILAKDPSLAGLLEKGGRRPGPPPGAPGEKPAAPEASGEKEGGRKGRGEGRRGGGLSPEERQKLGAAREEAAKNPDVQSAGLRRDAANSAYAAALKAAILKEDASLEPMVDKIVEHAASRRMERGPRRGGKPPRPQEEGEPKRPLPEVVQDQE